MTSFHVAIFFACLYAPLCQFFSLLTALIGRFLVCQFSLRQASKGVHRIGLEVSNPIVGKF